MLHAMMIKEMQLLTKLQWQQQQRHLQGLCIQGVNVACGATDGIELHACTTREAPSYSAKHCLQEKHLQEPDARDIRLLTQLNIWTLSGCCC
jgi:hypothetical protein